MISVSTFLWTLGASFAVIGTLGTILWKSMNRRMDKLEEAVSKAIDEVHEVRYNYLDRFEDMREHISTVKEEIIDRINNIG